MEKIISILLALTVLVLFTSCLSSGEDAGPKEGRGLAFLNHDYIVNTYSRIDTSNMTSQKSSWEINYYVDEFGNKTNDSFITTKNYIEGLFSNSATTNSEASLIILGNKDSMYFQVYEYSMLSPLSLLSFEEIMLKIREENGTIIETKPLSKDTNGKRFSLSYLEFVELMEALSKNNTLQLLFTVSSEYSTDNTYLFTVDTTGFVWAYKQAFCK